MDAELNKAQKIFLAMLMISPSALRGRIKCQIKNGFTPPENVVRCMSEHTDPDVQRFCAAIRAVAEEQLGRGISSLGSDEIAGLYKLQGYYKKMKSSDVEESLDEVIGYGDPPCPDAEEQRMFMDALAGLRLKSE